MSWDSTHDLVEGWCNKWGVQLNPLAFAGLCYDIRQYGKHQRQELLDEQLRLATRILTVAEDSK